MVNARSFLFPFKYSHRVAYVIEFSHKKIRMYAQGKLVRDMSKTTMSGESGTTGGIPDDIVEKVFPVLEIASPYAYSDLWDNEEQCCKIQTIQHSDILYIFNEDFPLMVLKRYSNTTWVLEELEIRNGPFLSMNTTDISIATDELEGEVQLTATGDVFSKTDVGRLVRLRIFDDDTTPWQAGKIGFQGTICVSDNKYYQAITGDETGSIKPVHSEGTRSDGGVLWEYLHDGSGIVKITEVVDKQHVKGTTVTRLPDAIKSGTVCWELGMLHKASKYPKSGAFFRNRFAFLVNTDTGPNVCLSYSGDYNNFADMECGEATAETAITVPVLNTEFNEGKWIYARDVLFVGTGASEFYVDVVSSASPLASDNVKISQISRVGSKAIMPLSVGSHVIFVDRYGLSLRDLTYNYYNDGYDEMDISLLGKHLFQSRITGMAYQEVPDKVLWCMVGDGSLTALTFRRNRKFRHCRGTICPARRKAWRLFRILKTAATNCGSKSSAQSTMPTTEPWNGWTTVFRSTGRRVFTARQAWPRGKCWRKNMSARKRCIWTGLWCMSRMNWTCRRKCPGWNTWKGLKWRCMPTGRFWNRRSCRAEKSKFCRRTGMWRQGCRLRASLCRRISIFRTITEAASARNSASTMCC